MGTHSNTKEHGGGGVVSGWQEGGRHGSQGRSLHSPAVVTQHFALLAQVLGVLLALVGHIQAIGLLQGSLQRGRRMKAPEGERKGQRERPKHRAKQGE